MDSSFLITLWVWLDLEWAEDCIIEVYYMTRVSRLRSRQVPAALIPVRPLSNLHPRSLPRESTPRSLLYVHNAHVS